MFWVLRIWCDIRFCCFVVLIPCCGFGWFWVSGLWMAVGLGWGVLRIDAGGASG